MSSRNAVVVAVMALVVGYTNDTAIRGAAAQSSDTNREPAEKVILSPIVVEGDTGVVTEGSDSYTTDFATVGGKQPQEIREVPQTITVITRERLDDADANTIEEAANLVANVTTALGDPFTGSLYVRGQEVFQYYIDGAPRPFLSIYGTAPDLYFFDRMEIVSGPSGVFQGSGEPVGTLNLVRKRPGIELEAQAAASIDTFGSYRGEADIGGALSESGNFRGRAAAFGAHKETFVDLVKQDVGGFYGTAEVDVTDDATVSVGTIIDRTEALRFSGLPTFNDGTLIDLPRDTFVGADWNHFDSTTGDVFAELETSFDSGGVLKLNSRYFDRDVSIKSVLGLTPVNPTTGIFRPFTFAREYEETSTYIDASFTQPFIVASLPGEVVGGVDNERTRQNLKQTFDFSAAPQNIFSFNPFIIVEPVINFTGVGPGFNLITKVDTTESGTYAQGRLEVLSGLKLNVGGRMSWYDTSSRDIGRNTRTSNRESKFTPYAGVTYDVLSDVTVYSSYAEIFQPQTELQSDGSVVEPRIGTQYEIGAKASLNNGRLNAQASAYIIDDDNRAAPDPANIGFFVPTGEARTRGYELAVVGSPLPGWEISTGYAYVDTELTNDPTPRHSAVAFAKYTFEGGTLDGFSLGGGVRAVSDFSILDNGIWINAPSYAVFNAYAGYQITEHISATLNVENIFDRKYVERVNTTSRGTFYGPPLSAFFRIKAVL